MIMMKFFAQGRVVEETSWTRSHLESIERALKFDFLSSIPINKVKDDQQDWMRKDERVQKYINKG